MTVEELYIKISADAENFKREIASANTAINLFRNNAVTAGKEITDAFSGLIGTDVYSGQKAPESDSGGTAVTGDYSPGSIEKPSGYYSRSDSVYIFDDEKSSPDSITYPDFYTYYNARHSGSKTVSVMDISDRRNGGTSLTDDSKSDQPIQITTEVVLDGDKIGESVNNFFMRRGRITNGAEQ